MLNKAWAIVAFAAVLAPAAFGQVAATPIAGGGPPNGALATNIALSYTYGVAVDASGNLYIPIASQNRVIAVAASGAVTIVAGKGTPGFSGDAGSALNASLKSPRSVAVDGAGNIYIADTGNCRIRKVSGGIITTVVGSGSCGFAGDAGQATSAQISSQTSVAVDAAGNLYISDQYNQRIRKVTGGIITTIAGTGTAGYAGDGGLATSAQLSYPNGIAVDGSGNVYVADNSNNCIRKISAGTISTVAGNATPGYSGDGGLATSAQLNGPTGVAVDSTGNLYISDSNNCRARKVSGGVITTMAGSASYGFSGDGGQATSARLTNPSGVAVDNTGNLYIADLYNYRIRKVSGGIISTVAGNGSIGYSGDNGPATSAQVTPGSIAVDSAGNLYISDYSDYRIRKVSGGVITTVAGTGASGFAGDGGAATSAQIATPFGIAMDSAGGLYISDPYNCRVRKVLSGIISTVVGSGTCGFLGDGGAAASAQLSYPSSLAVDGAGTLFIADQNRIRKVSGGVISLLAGGGPPNGAVATSVSILPAGAAVDTAGNIYVPSQNDGRVYQIATNGTISTIAGNGTSGFSGDGGPATSAQLNYPASVAVDGTGNVYIADAGNQRIRRVSGGIITTVAGGSSSGLGDGGQATSAQLNSPYGIAVDSAGSNLYIADTYNQRIRKVTGGIITTVAGNGTPGLSGDTGLATSAQLYFPYGVAVDGSGNFYIADTDNCVVRKVVGGVITRVAGNGTCNFSGDGGPATSAQLAYPYSVTVDSTGNVYIADANNYRVRKVSSGTITTVAGSGCCGALGDGGQATSAWLANPIGVAVDSANNLYIADQYNYRIRKVTGGIISTIAGNGFSSFSGDGGPAVASQLSQPTGLAVDSAGNLYFSDSGNSRVRLITAGGVISTFAGGGSGGQGDGGAATSGTLANPRGVAVSGSNVYIADRGTGLLRVVNGGIINTVVTIASTGSYGYSGDMGVAVDSTGKIYVSDPTSSVVDLVGSAPPQVVSVTPASGSGMLQSFSFVYSDGAGGADLAWAYASVNNGVTSCMVQADVVHGSLYLLNDAMTAWLGPIAVGSASSLQNSQCTLSGTGSTTAISGTQLTLNLNLAFKGAFAGPKYVFGYAQTAGGLNTGWIQLGTWTVPTVQALSVSPASGTGITQTFSFLFSDGNGGADLTVAYASINDGAKACMVQADLVHGLLYLSNDAMNGWLGPMAVGTGTTLQNSQCTVNGIGSSVVVSGSLVTWNLALTFKAAFVGVKNIFGYGQTAGGLGTGWASLGTWTITGNPPQAVSVTPTSGNGLSQTFSFLFTDVNGAADMTTAYASFNDGVKACMVQADLVHNTLYLLNDAMTAWAGPITVGTATSLQNSQCTVNGTGSVISMVGNQVTWNLALLFKPAFVGAKTVYGYVQSAGVLNSGWTALGTWTVPGTAAPQVVSVSPSSGSGSSRTFSFTYSDPYGGSDMVTAYGSINNGVKACMVQADLVHGWLYLLNDAMNGWVGPIAAGTATTIQNSQCTVSGIGSAVVVSGNQATLSVALTFQPAFAGLKNVYGYVQSAGGLNSGWVALGTWTAQ